MDVGRVAFGVAEIALTLTGLVWLCLVVFRRDLKMNKIIFLLLFLSICSCGAKENELRFKVKKRLQRNF